LGPGQGHHTGAAHSAVGGFKAHDSAQGRRTPDGPSGAGTQGAHGLTRRHRRPRPAGGAAGDVVQVPGVAGRFEAGGPIGAAQGELVHGQLAQQHGAGGFQPGVGGAIVKGHPVGVNPGSRGCAYAGSVIKVFESDGNAVERPLVAASYYLGLGGAGLLQRLVWQKGNEGMEPIVGGFNSVQECPGQLHRRQLPEADEFAGFLDCQKM